jgi:putative DNA primase/helicase
MKDDNAIDARDQAGQQVHQVPPARSPAYAVMQIDDKVVTSLRFERTEKEGAPAYTVSYLMGSKSVMRLKELDAAQLVDAVGERNAKSIVEHEQPKGTLKGESLINEQGVSPDAAVKARAQSTPALEASAGDRTASEDRDASDERNVVEAVQEKDLEVIDGKEVAARAAQIRQLEREKLERAQRERDDLGQRAEAKRVGVENLGEKAREQDQANDLAEKTGAPGDRRDQLATEREKNRQIELMELVHSQFRVSGAKYHFKDQPAKVAFKDQGSRMVSGSNDDRVAHAMATMAEAKGWKTIKVSGHPDFVREVWMEASLRGLAVRGYKPTEQDLAQMEARRDHAMRNKVEQVPQREHQAGHRDAGADRKQTAQEQRKDGAEPTIQADRDKGATGAQKPFSGRLVEHGPANYNHDPAERMSYFVKLATNKGERTVWGVDLKRAIEASKAKAGDDVTLEFKGNQPVTVKAPKRDGEGRVVGQEEIDTNRNTWEVRKSDRHKVAEAVASAVIDAKVRDPAQRQALKAAVGARLAERDKDGKVPAVPVYDKTAPARTRERTGPVVERNAERTRSR